jgi:hypothetical protein
MVATRSRGTRRSVLDQFIPHADTVMRGRVVLAVSPAVAWAWLRRFDFARLGAAVGRAIEDMRAVPPLVARVAHRAAALPSTARLMLADAPSSGLIRLAEKPGRHVVVGAVGKLWKPRVQLVRLDPDEFVAFHDAKYVKVITGFLVLPYGSDRTLLKHETRFLATDDTARTHFRRWWRVVQPYVEFFFRRVMKAFRGAAQEQRAAPAMPRWR